MKKCLIVDDSRKDRQIAARYLRRFGFQVKHAKDGNEGLDICRQHMPDVILVDHEMPNVDGLEFIKRLKKTRGGRHAVVLFCSAGRDTNALGSAIWQGAAECLVKPFDADLLDFKLQQVGAFETAEAQSA